MSDDKVSTGREPEILIRSLSTMDRYFPEPAPIEAPAAAPQPVAPVASEPTSETK